MDAHGDEELRRTAALGAREFGPLVVWELVLGVRRVSWGPEQVRRQAGRRFFLHLPLQGVVLAAQDGRTAQLRGGDFAVLDSARPFELGVPVPVSHVSVALPHDLLAPLLPAPHELTAVPVRGDAGVGALASSAIRALVEVRATVDGAVRRTLAEQLGGLVALALGGLRPRPPSPRDLLYRAALAEVERSLDDPDLTPAVVAFRLGVSTRLLHQLFAEDGRTFTRWLLKRRLDRCHGDLRDPGYDGWTIAQLAARAGFRDPSHLARVYRARYGTSPGAARSARLAA